MQQPTKLDKKKFSQHKRTAKLRGIEFNLTFEQWWSIWQESGHYHERGIKGGQYVMGRHGDTGPYDVTNVYICTRGENYDYARSLKSWAGSERKLTPEQEVELAELAATTTKKDLADMFGISRPTVYKILKRQRSTRV